MENKSFDVPIIGRNKLCCVICTVNYQDVLCSTARSSYHHQIMKCRYLMASVENNFIIGCPVPKNQEKFYVIITKDFYKNEFFRRIIQGLNLTTSEPQPVTPEAYSSCLKYTIDFYIAPSWNKVRNLYFEGKYFLTEKEKIPAVKYKIKLNSPEGSEYDKISIELISLTAKLFPIQLHNLFIPHSVIADFRAGSSELIDISLFGQPRVSVLPSMIKGRVMSVFKKIPPTCSFKNWTEMRRHWKNMYGYRLPETDEGILYYDIYFPMFNTDSKTNRFIYPDLCVRYELSEYSRADNDIIDRFINDFNNMMPNIGASYQAIKENSNSAQESSQGLMLPKADNNKICMKDTTNIPKALKESLNGLGDDRKFSRLSTSTSERLNHRRVSATMSPTPSLLGKRSSSPRKSLNFENLKKIKEAHGSQALQNYRFSSIANNQSHKQAFAIFNKPSSSSSVASNNFFHQPEESNSTKIFHSKKLNVQSQKNTNKKRKNKNIESQIDQVEHNKRSKPLITNDEKVSYHIDGEMNLQKNIKKFIIKKN